MSTKNMWAIISDTFYKANSEHDIKYEEKVCKCLKKLGVTEFWTRYECEWNLEISTKLQSQNVGYVIKTPVIHGIFGPSEGLQAESCFYRIAIALHIAQKYLKFVHNDLHKDNIMYVNTKVAVRFYYIDGIWYAANTCGIDPVIIDYGLSCIPGTVGPSPVMASASRVYSFLHPNTDLMRLCTTSVTYKRVAKCYTACERYNVFPLWNKPTDNIVGYMFSYSSPEWIVQYAHKKKLTRGKPLCRRFVKQALGTIENTVKSDCINLVNVIAPTVYQHAVQSHNMSAAATDISCLDFLPKLEPCTFLRAGDTISIWRNKKYTEICITDDMANALCDGNYHIL